LNFACNRDLSSFVFGRKYIGFFVIAKSTLAACVVGHRLKILAIRGRYVGPNQTWGEEEQCDSQTVTGGK